MNVTFYTGFTKRVNSTKRPSGGTTLSVALKDDTSIESPVFRLDKGNNAAYMNYNYCQFNGSYYYIDDVVLTNRNIYEYHCRKDVLATERAHIMASEQYVSRSSSDYNGYIPDTWYATNGTIESGYVTPSSPQIGGTFVGCNISECAFILGVAGQPSQGNGYSIGAGNYYIMDYRVMYQLLEYLANPGANYYGISTAALDEGLQKALINPFQYIITLFAVPMKYETIVANIPSYMSRTTIHFGWGLEYPILNGLTCYCLDPRYAIQTAMTWTVNVPEHPQSSVSGREYLNFSPYSEVSLFWQPFGQVKIDTSWLQSTRTIKCTVKIDLVTGKGYLYITDPSGNVIYHYVPADVGVVLPINANDVDRLAIKQASDRADTAAITSGISGLSSAAKLDVAGFAANAYSGLRGQSAGADEIMRLSAPVVQVEGIPNSMLVFEPPRLNTKYYYVSPMDLTKYGAPLLLPKKLSTLSGFCMVESPVYGSAIREEDNLSVIQFLKGGIYLE